MTGLEIPTESPAEAEARGRAEGREEVLDVLLTLRRADECDCIECVRDELTAHDIGMVSDRAL